LTQAKRRPAWVIAVLQGDDVILCQITSQTVADNQAIASWYFCLHWDAPHPGFMKQGSHKSSFLKGNRMGYFSFTKVYFYL
jgi:hypothetical protein